MNDVIRRHTYRVRLKLGKSSEMIWSLFKGAVTFSEEAGSLTKLA